MLRRSHGCHRGYSLVLDLHPICLFSSDGGCQWRFDHRSHPDGKTAKDLAGDLPVASGSGHRLWNVSLWTLYWLTDPNIIRDVSRVFAGNRRQEPPGGESVCG